MKLRLALQVTGLSKNLFAFVENVDRLCKEHKDFTFGFKQGKKLYLDTCKGMQNNWYISIKQQPNVQFIVATLNYSLALGSFIDLSLVDNVLYFDISFVDKDAPISNDEDILQRKVQSFADGLGLQYTLI